MLTLLQLSWDQGGPLIDFGSITTVKEIPQIGTVPICEYSTRSLFCFSIRMHPFSVYLELIGNIVLDTYKDEEIEEITE